MDMAQLMEGLLAKMDTDKKEMLAAMKANEEMTAEWTPKWGLCKMS
jgi:hypothetical protein